jgi:hypothetical protein
MSENCHSYYDVIHIMMFEIVIHIMMSEIVIHFDNP